MADLESLLFTRLSALDIKTVTHTHAAVHTVDDNRRLRGDLPGGHCKNLFLKDKKGQVWLVVALEDRAIDMKTLKTRIGAAHLSFGQPGLLADILGVTPGSVTPLALINDTEARVRVVLDAGLFDFGVVNFHPLVNTATTAIAPQDLVRFIESCGHQPARVDLNGMGNS